MCWLLLRNVSAVVAFWVGWWVGTGIAEELLCGAGILGGMVGRHRVMEAVCVPKTLVPSTTPYGVLTQNTALCAFIAAKMKYIFVQVVQFEVFFCYTESIGSNFR